MNLRVASVTTFAVALAASGACRQNPDVDKVPVGTNVQLTKDDGGVVSGKLTARTDDAVKVDVGPVVREVPRDEVADVRIVDPKNPPGLPPEAKFREIAVPADTLLAVRLDTDVSSRTSHLEDPVEATLTQPVVLKGREVLPAGSVVRGIVSAVQSSGNVKGRAALAVRFRSVTTPAGGDRYTLSATVRRVAPSQKKKDIETIAIPAAGAAAVGAILGGKKGAAIGGAIGGAAGAATVLSTAGPEVTLARGAHLTLSLAQPLNVRVPL